LQSYQHTAGSEDIDLIINLSRDGQSAAPEVMRILGNNGNVGIGNNAPQAKLDVNGSGNFTGTVGIGGNLNVTGSLNTGNATVSGFLGVGKVPTVPIDVNGNVKATAFIGDGSQLTGVQTPWLRDIDGGNFALTNVNKLRVAGSVGIGTTTPAATLDVVGTANVSGNVGIGGNANVTGTMHSGNATVDGFLGIGKTATVPLDVNGTVKANTFIGDGSQLTGIATGSQQTPWLIDINGNGKSLTNVAKIGVGIANPTNALHVIGKSRFSGSVLAEVLTPNSLVSSASDDSLQSVTVGSGLTLNGSATLLTAQVPATWASQLATNTYAGMTNALGFAPATNGAAGGLTTLFGSATLTFGQPNTPTNSFNDQQIPVPGAADGDVVALGIPSNAVQFNGSFFAWATLNAVNVRYLNHDGIAHQPIGLFKARVFK
jgi:hypothetical protein